MRRDGARQQTLPQRRLVATVVAALVGVVAIGVSVGVLLGSAARSTRTASAAAAVVTVETRGLPRAESIPVPVMSAGPSAAASHSPCEDPALNDALAAGDDARAIAVVGGGAAFREQLVAGNLPCVRLDQPNRLWLVVNKQRPFSDIRYAPATLVAPSGMRMTTSILLEPRTADALVKLAGAAGQQAGAIAVASGYRSYDTQLGTHDHEIDAGGVSQAEMLSARAGYSEHQSGFAADVAACASSCSAMESFGGTKQSAWVTEHAWEYGFIIRYEEGQTGITGYSPEPWHLRYIGTELAKAYHDGGYRTLEEFWALPAAPDYPS